MTGVNRSGRVRPRVEAGGIVFAKRQDTLASGFDTDLAQSGCAIDFPGFAPDTDWAPETDPPRTTIFQSGFDTDFAPISPIPGHLAFREPFRAGAADSR